MNVNYVSILAKAEGKSFTNLSQANVEYFNCVDSGSKVDEPKSVIVESTNCSLKPNSLYRFC